MCWSAQFCLGTPGHLTEGDGNHHAGVIYARRRPVISPEVVVLPAKDFSNINRGRVDELDMLQPFGLMNLLC